jgi:uncharacterized protein YbjT (DUF2867 family)
MELLVTGASGMLGRRVTDLAEMRGHVVRRLTGSDRPRDGWRGGDPTTGGGVSAAIEGVGAVLHCVSARRWRRQVETTRDVAAAAARRGVHVVFPGVVGSDLIPLGYHRSMTRAEEVLVESGCPFTIRRYTQFHEVIWRFLDALTRPPAVALVPNDTRFQVLDANVAARSMVDAAETGAAGRLPDLGGPTVYDVRELARSVAIALGRRRTVVGVNAPGLAGAAFRAGANLTEARDHSGATWNDFVAAKIARAL